MTLEIKQITFEELENTDEFSVLCKEYAEEASSIHMPANMDAVKYRKLSEIKSLFIFAAYKMKKLIGFVAVVPTNLSHYSTTILVIDAIFVKKEHRKYGTGLKLIREAEKFSNANKYLGVLGGVPIGGILEKVYPKLGYTPVNVLFFKKSKNA